jgi:predicted secreted protein
MSALITDKLVTPCGSITNPTLGGYVDAAGNVVGSPGFLPNYVIDYAGNFGAIPNVNVDCTFIATIIGSALPPGDWEMQLGTVETVGLDGSTIGTSYVAGTTAATTLHSFVSLNATGYLTGAVSGTGTWTIKAGPEAINGTGYVGSGLLVATGANTHTGLTTMQSGTKLQLGGAASPQIFSDIANVTGISGPDGQSPEIDVTNFADTARRFLAGLPDNGSVSADINWSSDENTNTTLYQLYQSGDTRQYRIVLSNGDYFEFNAVVLGHPFTFAIDDVVKASISLRVSGAVSFTQV